MTPSKRPILLHIEPAGDADSAAQAIASAMANEFDGVEIAVPNMEEWSDGPNAKADQGVIAASARCRSTDVADGMAEVCTLLHRVATCGATCLNLTLPPVDASRDGVGFSRYQDGLNFAYRVLYDLRYEAERAGVAIAIEAASAGGLLSPVELREIINQANSPAVGVCLDVARVSRVGVAEDWIRTLGYRLKSVRFDLSSYSELDSLTAALDAARFDGPVIVRGAGDSDRLSTIIARLAGAMADR